ncbi:hypothetical protein [Clostridium gasigenes]|uniref:hypothetical protein n=1 Tax=Clostridium gasigenes TaxID=94869 RepID=UPI001FABAC2F|nr:hypothetical protein [Clostridium gasigenes]
METKLIRIAEIAKEKPKEKFTSLYHYINKEMLLNCHKQLLGNKATGIDDVTKKEYSKELYNNIEDLVEILISSLFHIYCPKYLFYLLVLPSYLLKLRHINLF